MRTAKLNFTIIKIPHVNTMKTGFLCDKKIPHLKKKITHLIWNTVDRKKRFNNRKPSILSQVGIILFPVSAVLSYSNGNSSKKSHQSSWNLSTSKVQSRFLDRNDEGKFSGHLCHRRNDEKHVEEDFRDETSSIGHQASTKLLEPQEPNQNFPSNQGTTGELFHGWKATTPSHQRENEDMSRSKPNQNFPSHQGTTEELFPGSKAAVNNPSHQGDNEDMFRSKPNQIFPSNQGTTTGELLPGWKASATTPSHQEDNEESIETTNTLLELHRGINFNGTVIIKLASHAMARPNLSILTKAERKISCEQPMEFAEAHCEYATCVAKLEPHSYEPPKWSEKLWKIPWTWRTLGSAIVDIIAALYLPRRIFQYRPGAQLNFSNGIYCLCPLPFDINGQLDFPNSRRVEILGISSCSLAVDTKLVQLAPLAATPAIIASACDTQLTDKLRHLVLHLTKVLNEASTLFLDSFISHAVQTLFWARALLKSASVHLQYPSISRSVSWSSWLWSLHSACALREAGRGNCEILVQAATTSLPWTGPFFGDPRQFIVRYPSHKGAQMVFSPATIFPTARVAITRSATSGLRPLKEDNAPSALSTSAPRTFQSTTAPSGAASHAAHPPPPRFNE